MTKMNLSGTGAFIFCAVNSESTDFLIPLWHFLINRIQNRARKSTKHYIFFLFSAVGSESSFLTFQIMCICSYFYFP